MIIKDDKFRIGTAAPYGWVDNTATNRVAHKLGNGNYDKSLFYILYYSFIRLPLGRLRYKHITVNWWKLRCALGFHQKNANNWCFWCNKPLKRK